MVNKKQLSTLGFVYTAAFVYEIEFIVKFYAYEIVILFVVKLLLSDSELLAA